MPTQDLLIYNDGNQYQVLDEITRQPLSASLSASQAIQRAVDLLAASGGEITLSRGEFNLDKPVNLASHISLRGKGRASKLRVKESNQEGVALSCKGLDGVRIADLTITAGGNANASSGIVVDDCGDCKVHNIFVGGFSDYGIWIRNRSFLCAVDSCSLAGNGKANIFLDDLGKSGKERGRAGEFVPVLLSNCMIYGGGKGVECKLSIVVNIVGCCVFQTRDTGFHIHTQSNSVVISGCRTFQVGKYALLLENSDEFNLTGNIFCWHLEDGLVIRNANWGTICGNEVIDTGSYNSGVEDFTAQWDTLPPDLPPYTAVKLANTYGYTISGNAIFNWGVVSPMAYGIYEDAASFRNVIHGNTINYFSQADVVSLGKESKTSQNNATKERPYHIRDRAMPEFFQTFQTSLVEDFIREQL